MIKLSASKISKSDELAVSKSLKDGYLGMGLYTKKFEELIKSYLNTSKEVICVNTGTSALHLSLLSLNLKCGDEIIVPSITYVASFQAITAAGGVPIACEIDSSTGFIDIADCKKKITKKTRAIMPVYYASDANKIKEIYKIAKEFNLRVVEDAAHAFGSVVNNILVGKKGDILCFSFDGIKNITSGEGGAVVTGDKKLAQFIKDARLLGVHNDTIKRYSKKRSWDFSVNHQGFRYHMSNINASLGISQLKQINTFANFRRKLVNNYLQNLSGLSEIEFLRLDYKNIFPHIFVIKVKNNMRNKLKEYLLENGIETGIHWKPNHQLSFFQ